MNVPQFATQQHRASALGPASSRSSPAAGVVRGRRTKAATLAEPTGLHFSTAHSGLVRSPGARSSRAEPTNDMPLRRCEEDAALAPRPWSANHAGLQRGRNGIDAVLQHVRESQRLYNELQERRMEGERKRIQQSLSKDLDDQREHKNMLRVAEYQQELVHMYGPTVRDIILDVFFDDSSDPVVNLLKDEQLDLRSDRRGRASAKGASSQSQLYDAWNEARASHLLLRGEDGMTARLTPPSALHTPEAEDPAAAAMSRKRESLNRALDYCRNSRKCAY